MLRLGSKLSAVSLLLLLAACASSDDLASTGGSASQGGSTSSGTRGEGGSAGEPSLGGDTGTGGQPPCEQVEICGDGLDNDCNGDVDDGCDCAPGDTRPCFTGEPDAIGVGECAEGVQTCDENGKWGVTCDGQVLPGHEECDGLDNDCNGEVDEGFGDQTCGLGLCVVTVPSCENGAPVVCVPLDPPSDVDLCAGEDDDCNGTADQGCACSPGETQPCYSGPPGTDGVGICHAGVQTCVGGQFGACSGEVKPGTESCDSVDQDCDGNVNEGACSLANASSSCSGGGCVIDTCATGWDQCDGNVGNGCETHHAGASNAPPGQDLGAFGADSYYGFGCSSGGSCEGPISSVTGTQGRYFDIGALESSSCCSYVSLRFELVVPPGIDYDLFVTGTGCFADPDFQSINGTGVNETITVWCEDDCGGADNGFDAGIEVRYYSGSSCDPWTLNVYRRAC